MKSSSNKRYHTVRNTIGASKIEFLPLSKILVDFGFTLLGLMIGSFLNVIIHRLPQISEIQYRSICAEYIETFFRYKKIKGSFNQKRKFRKIKTHFGVHHNDDAYSLSTPKSHCPNCLRTLSWTENIPIFSFLILKGRCKTCKTPIGKTYPLVEFISAAGALYISTRLYVPVTENLDIHLLMKTASLCIFFWMCIALLIIDIRTQTLPDLLTLSLMWLGIFFSLTSTTGLALESAVLGAIFGYSSLWLIYKTYKFFTKKEGMGYGDFKLTAAICTWIGVESLAILLLIASLTGAFFGGLLLITKKLKRDEAMPFGPFLILSGFILMHSHPSI